MHLPPERARVTRGGDAAGQFGKSQCCAAAGALGGAARVGAARGGRAARSGRRVVARRFQGGLRRQPGRVDVCKGGQRGVRGRLARAGRGVVTLCGSRGGRVGGDRLCRLHRGPPRRQPALALGLQLGQPAQRLRGGGCGGHSVFKGRGGSFPLERGTRRGHAPRRGRHRGRRGAGSRHRAAGGFIMPGACLRQQPFCRRQRGRRRALIAPQPVHPLPRQLGARRRAPRFSRDACLRPLRVMPGGFMLAGGSSFLGGQCGRRALGRARRVRRLHQTIVGGAQAGPTCSGLRFAQQGGRREAGKVGDAVLGQELAQIRQLHPQVCHHRQRVLPAAGGPVQPPIGRIGPCRQVAAQGAGGEAGAARERDFDPPALGAAAHVLAHVPGPPQDGGGAAQADTDGADEGGFAGAWVGWV